MQEVNLSLPPIKNERHEVVTLPITKTSSSNSKPESNFSVSGMVILTVFLFFIIGWIASVIDILTSDFKNGSNKIAWLLALIFVSPLFLVYIFVAPSMKVKKGKKRK